MGKPPKLPQQAPPTQVLVPEKEETELEIQRRFLEGGRRSTILTSRTNKGRGVLG